MTSPVASEDTKISLKAPAISSLASQYSGIYPIRPWGFVYLNISQNPQYLLFFDLNMNGCWKFRGTDVSVSVGKLVKEVEE